MSVGASFAFVTAIVRSFSNEEPALSVDRTRHRARGARLEVERLRGLKPIAVDLELPVVRRARALDEGVDMRVVAVGIDGREGSGLRSGGLVLGDRAAGDTDVGGGGVRRRSPAASHRLTVSLPRPPSQASTPGPPSRVSAPPCPNRRSSSSPPLILSLSGPPQTTSSPPEATIRSAPPPAAITSSPGVPRSLSLPRSSPFVPFSVALEPAHLAARGAGAPSPVPAAATVPATTIERTAISGGRRRTSMLRGPRDIRSRCGPPTTLPCCTGVLDEYPPLAPRKQAGRRERRRSNLRTMWDVLGPPLKAAGIAAFVTGLVLLFLNPPSLNGAEDFLMVAGRRRRSSSSWRPG